MSSVMDLRNSPDFENLVSKAVLARASVTPSGEPSYVSKRTKYNRAVLSLPDRLSKETKKYILPVLMNPSIATDYSTGGINAIKLSDVEYVVETEMVALMSTMSDMIDPALILHSSIDSDVVEDIAGSIVQYVLSVLSTPEATSVGASSYTTQLRDWAKKNLQNAQSAKEAAKRAAVFVMADTEMAETVSMYGVGYITSNSMLNAVGRVMPVFLSIDSNAYGYTPVAERVV